MDDDRMERISSRMTAWTKRSFVASFVLLWLIFVAMFMIGLTADEPVSPVLLVALLFAVIGWPVQSYRIWKKEVAVLADEV